MPSAGNVLQLDNNLGVGNSGCLRYNGTLGRLEFAHDCANYSVFSDPIWSPGAPDEIYYNTGVARVGIGNNNPNYTLDVSGVLRVTDHVVIDPSAGAVTPTFFDLDDLQSVSITALSVDDLIQWNGSAWVNVPEASVSDMRMKYDLNRLENSLDKVLSLNGYSFKIIGRPDDRIDYGVSAQEVEVQFPELVRIVDKENGTLGVDYEGLIAPLIESIKEQQKQIDELRAEIDSLKSSDKSQQENQ